MVVFQVRRTRISERMRKLQELVPNMDKVDFFPFNFRTPPLSPFFFSFNEVLLSV